MQSVRNRKPRSSQRHGGFPLKATPAASAPATTTGTRSWAFAPQSSWPSPFPASQFKTCLITAEGKVHLRKTKSNSTPLPQQTWRQRWTGRVYNVLNELPGIATQFVFKKVAHNIFKSNLYSVPVKNRFSSIAVNLEWFEVRNSSHCSRKGNALLFVSFCMRQYMSGHLSQTHCSHTLPLTVKGRKCEQLKQRTRKRHRLNVDNIKSLEESTMAILMKNVERLSNQNNLLLECFVELLRNSYVTEKIVPSRYAGKKLRDFTEHVKQTKLQTCFLDQVEIPMHAFFLHSRNKVNIRVGTS